MSEKILTDASMVERIHEAIGYASRCWDDMGVFKTSDAIRVCDELCADFRKLESERDKLLEENKGLKERIQSIQGDDADYILAAEKERDDWRGMAEKLSKVLGQAALMLRCGGPTMRPCTSCDAKEVLADYSKLSGEKGEGK